MMQETDAVRASFVRRAVDVGYHTAVALLLVASLAVLELATRRFLSVDPTAFTATVHDYLFHAGHVLVLLGWVTDIGRRFLPSHIGRQV